MAFYWCMHDSVFVACEMPRLGCAMRVPWYFTRVKVHVHTLRETWSTQTRDVNLEYLCRVSLRVHACKSEVINERYCIQIAFYICKEY